LLASTELYTPTDGTWGLTGNLNSPRFWFGNLVVLNNGKVLVATGTADPGYNEYFSSELYDPSSGTWTYTGNVNVARRSPSLTLLNDGRVLLAGGRQGIPDPCSGFLASSETFDPSTGNWSHTVGNMNVAREAHNAILLPSGKVLIAGGYGACGVHYDYGEIFDPATGLWTVTNSMSAGMLFGSLTLLPSGKVLRAGGETSSGTYTALAELYDPATGNWTPTGSMKIARWQHTANLLDDGRVLIAGGYDATGELTSSEVFDPGTGTWTIDANLNQKRREHSAIKLPNGRVLVAGGTAMANALSSCELYKVASPSNVTMASFNLRSEETVNGGFLLTLGIFWAIVLFGRRVLQRSKQHR